MTSIDWSAVQDVCFSNGGVILGIAFCAVLLGIWIHRNIPDFPKAPNDLDITTDLSLATRWIQSKKWLLRGRAMLIDAHVPGKTYMLPTPKNYCVFISAENNIKEFASSSNFSLHQAYDDLFSYRYNKLWHDEGESVHMTQIYYFRVLREGLTTKLPVLYPYMHETLVKGVADHLARKKAVDVNRQGWKQIHHYPFLEYITVSVIGPIFWGESLWANPEFQDAARRFPAQYFAFGEIVQHVPTFAVPLVKFAVTKGNKYRNILIKHLLPIVSEQMAEARNTPKSEENLPFINFIQYTVLMTQGKPYWTQERIILLLESLWRAGGHSVPMTLTHIMNSLCQYPEYMEPIREELDQQPQMNFSVLESLPLLNSFIKEVIRTKPLDSASTRRKALKTHTFKDGPHVPAGNLVCIPSYGIMNDAALYPNPEVFNGFRFTTRPTSDNQESIKGKQGETTRSKVTDVDLSFPFWGYGKEACPGRFFASFEMKSVIALLVSRYDFKLANADKPTTWLWRTFTLPRKDTVLLIRERSEH
ncbi:Cytochrome P450 [Venustampulla echinocandica]|uniref:Cytochrome P450 n=1 Tax=Venustampulla echinocandica TaxID=2656787 RepID=A0A370TX39_9HELO|nr:Cytochrome P450 [Venustampulla echinocandica]RDL40096.1 Cytochrome P450 [Venustampulla echinocandica]